MSSLTRNVPHVLGWIALILCVGGCALKINRRELSVRPLPSSTLDGQTAFLKAHRPDGRLHVFDRWQIDEANGTITGWAESYNPQRDKHSAAKIVVAIDSVAIFESNVIQTSPAVGALTVLSVLSSGVSAYCLANPKACFGSCPTFYAPDEEGGAPLLQAEGFSASVAPVLEDDDLDKLVRCRAEGRRFEIVMTNEALETHVVRRVDLLVAPRPADGQVLADNDGGFWRTGPLRAPRSAAGPEGDVLARIAAADGDERASPSDPLDLAAREELTLEFAAPPDGPCGLFLVSRQALVSTYLFYQGLAYLGRDAAPTLARAQQVLEPSAGGNTFGAVLGRIDVLARATDGSWRLIGQVGETGPLAPNGHFVPLGPDLAVPLQVRLRMARGCWRLDQVAVAAIRGPAEIRRLVPAQVRCDAAPDADALARLLDSESSLVTYPGDRYTLVYDLPETGGPWDVFLHSRGYYLEWMRQEWLAEENPIQAARLFLAPVAMLRELAPEFKRLEPNMEAEFWGSRYAR